jgi:RNA polymerase sigma-70 factor (ECF subfamily)
MAIPGTNDPNHQAVDDGLRLDEFVRELTASQGRIRAFITSLMPGSSDVGDVLQETNLTLWKSRSRFRPGSNFLAWAFTIARLEVHHQRSRNKRLKRILFSDELLDLLAEEIPMADDHEVFLNALEACKSKLSENQLALIESRYRPGHSLDELARQTGRNPSALRVALMRIRIALRECVEKSLKQHYA